MNMTKQEILEKIFFFKDDKERNDHDNPDQDPFVDNPFFVVSECFTKDELLVMSETELKNSLELAAFTYEAVLSSC